MNYNKGDYLIIYEIIRKNEDLSLLYSELDEIKKYLQLLCFNNYFVTDDEIIKYMYDSINLLNRLREDNRLHELNDNLIDFISRGGKTYSIVNCLNVLLYPTDEMTKNKVNYYIIMKNMISSSYYHIVNIFYDHSLSFNNDNYNKFLNKQENTVLYDLYKLVIIYLNNANKLRPLMSTNRDLSVLFTNLSTIMISYLYGNKTTDYHNMEKIYELLFLEHEEIIDDCYLNGVFLNKDEGLNYIINNDIIEYEDRYMERIIDKVNPKRKIRVIS